MSASKSVVTLAIESSSKNSPVSSANLLVASSCMRSHLGAPWAGWSVLNLTCFSLKVSFLLKCSRFRMVRVKSTQHLQKTSVAVSHLQHYLFIISKLIVTLHPHSTHGR